MKKSSLIKILIATVCVIPYLLNYKYLINTWMYSPLEKHGFYLLLLGLGLFIHTIFMVKKIENHYNKWYSLVVIGGFIILGIGVVKEINTAIILGSFIIWWGSIASLYGWNVGYYFIPSFVFFMSSCPNVAYWIGFFIGIDGRFFIGGICLGGFIWHIINYHKRVVIPFHNIIFSLLAIFAAILYLLPNVNNMLIDPFKIDVTLKIEDRFLGRETAPTSSDITFFGNSTIERYFFTNDKIEEVHLLKITHIDDINKIHPIAHCFSSGGSKIISNKVIEVNLKNGKIISVNEVISEYARKRVLTWTWYSTSKNSTGSFLLFRKNFSYIDDWENYQISTDIKDDVEDSRILLKEFINGLIKS